MSDTQKFTLYVTLKKLEGEDMPSDYVVDALCGSLGRQNGAGKDTFTFDVQDDDNHEATYEIELLDDRPDEPVEK